MPLRVGEEAGCRHEARAGDEAARVVEGRPHERVDDGVERGGTRRSAAKTSRGCARQLPLELVAPAVDQREQRVDRRGDAARDGIGGDDDGGGHGLTPSVRRHRVPVRDARSDSSRDLLVDQPLGGRRDVRDGAPSGAFGRRRRGSPAITSSRACRCGHDTPARAGTARAAGRTPPAAAAPRARVAATG